MEKNAKIRMNKIAPHPNRAFTVVPYDTDWPHQFEQLVQRLKNVLDKEILAIEHVGSTAVPGMPAKPQIDVVVVVPKLDSIPPYYEKMRANGFTPRGDYVGEGEEYFTEDTAQGLRIASVHVLPKGHVWIDDLVQVRDYLRMHPAEMQRYAEVKLKAMHDNPHDYDAYYKRKVEIIQQIRQQAANWKANLTE